MNVEQLEQILKDHADQINTLMDCTSKLRDPGLKQPISNFGVYTAICVSTMDVWKENSIQFFSPYLHDPTEEVDGLPWAAPISSFGGFDDSGSTWVPPAGSSVIVAFEGGMSGAAYYLGTTWTRSRGANGLYYFGIPIDEYNDLYLSSRNGYLCGPNDGSQVFPPWNTESYNGYDIDSIEELSSDPSIQKRMTYPNIYGFKTQEKHMMKMVDGDPKCNRKWKRVEIMSGNGNWMIFKDDHLHYCGQWAHPSCANNEKDGDTSCIVGLPNPQPYTFNSLNSQTTVINNQIQTQKVDIYAPVIKSENTGCQASERSTIIGGEPESQVNQNSQVGRNPFFKHISECRPYKGPQTPQNNRCDLPQTGIQLLSISGHTFVMDDSVNQPQGDMEWKRGTQPFDFGCDNKFVGRTYWKSTTGHLIEMNDVERVGDNIDQVRADDNGIKIKSALGNQVFLCDAVDGTKCTDAASPLQGVKINSTSNHQIVLSDGGNKRDYPCRRDGAVPAAEATNAYMQLRTGYGLEIRMEDASTQKETFGQTISITAPQKTIENGSRPHQIVLREGFEGVQETGYVEIRSGGNLFIYTDENGLEYIKGHKINYVATNRYDYTEETFFHRGKGSHVIYFDERIYLLAGRDYPPIDPANNPENAPPENVLAVQLDQATNQATATDPATCIPGVFPVLVLGPNGCVKASDRVFASCSVASQPIGVENLNIDNRCAAQPDLCSGGIPLENNA